MTESELEPSRFVDAIRRSGLSIYDPIAIGDSELWIPGQELEALLDEGLRGVSLAGLPLRTRSKVVKERICRILGYPVPPVFRMTQPRFPGQLFDTYVQKSNNLQIWNEEIAATRRYVLIRVSLEDRISRVKVVTGDALDLLDTTGALTQKYQARCVPGKDAAELVVAEDTELLGSLVTRGARIGSPMTPLSYPSLGELLPISEVFERLRILVHKAFVDAGYDQERNRGAALHSLVSSALGYQDYQDDGRFPDIRHQLLEVKLQTSPTIDLGLVSPDSFEALDVPQIAAQQIRHRDVRYAIFYGRTDGREVVITHLFLTTGAAFFERFPKFGGKVLNKKLQIPLPANLFAR